jgi:hypothetical protein
MRFDARDWVARSVQWDPARTAVKHGVHAFAGLRGRRLQRTGTLPTIANLYTASSPKAGSQWMKALFDHPLVKSRTGLLTLPQLDYQSRPTSPFPAGTFVPGIYCSYEEFLRHPQRGDHRVVYMFRDPRDIVVSGYYAAVLTHRKTHLKEVEALRAQIRSLPFDQGLLLLIQSSVDRLREIESWVDVDDPAVASFRLEDVAADPRESVVRMLKHCSVALPRDELEIVLSQVSRESLQFQDLAQREPGSESHYRVRQQGFDEVFKPQHHEAIERIVPGLPQRLGYSV